MNCSAVSLHVLTNPHSVPGVSSNALAAASPVDCSAAGLECVRGGAEQLEPCNTAVVGAPQPLHPGAACFPLWRGPCGGVLMMWPGAWPGRLPPPGPGLSHNQTAAGSEALNRHSHVCGNAHLEPDDHSKIAGQCSPCFLHNGGHLQPPVCQKAESRSVFQGRARRQCQGEIAVTSAGSDAMLPPDSPAMAALFGHPCTCGLPACPPLPPAGQAGTPCAPLHAAPSSQSPLVPCRKHSPPPFPPTSPPTAPTKKNSPAFMETSMFLKNR